MVHESAELHWSCEASFYDKLMLCLALIRDEMPLELLQHHMSASSDDLFEDGYVDALRQSY